MISPSANGRSTASHFPPVREVQRSDIHIIIQLDAKDFPSLPKSSKYLVSRCLEPLKAEPQEVFGGPNTYSQGIWKTRICFQNRTLEKNSFFFADLSRERQRKKIINDRILYTSHYTLTYIYYMVDEEKHHHTTYIIIVFFPYLL